MKEVYWLEQNGTDVSEEGLWLSPAELQRLSEFRFPKRRNDWRLGRWTAKRAVGSCLGLPDDPGALAAIEIRAAASGVPEVFIAGKPASVSISLSHSFGHAACAVARGSAAIGCDVEKIEARSAAFVTDYLTEEEQSLVASSKTANRVYLLTLLWSAKESALKALHEGLRLDTRSMLVDPLAFDSGSKDWQPIQVRYGDAKVFHGWCRHDDRFVWTVVCDPTPSRPIALSCSGGAD